MKPLLPTPLPLFTFLYSLFTAALCAASPSFSPLQIGLDGMAERKQLVSRETPVAGLRLNLPASWNKSVTGLDIGLMSLVDESFTGLRCNALFAMSKSCNGVVVALFFDCSENVNGLQLSGWFAAGRNARGIQVAPRTHADIVQGVQLGIFNTAKTLQGLQLGLANACLGFDTADLSHGGEVCGLQLGAVNFVAGPVRGVQIGLFNRANPLRGLQLGLLNLDPSSPIPCLPLLRASF